MRLVALVVALSAAAVAFAVRPVHAGTWVMWVGLAVPYALLAALALYKMWDEGTLVDRLTPKWGDLSVGAVTALLLLLASFGARVALAPGGTPRNAWLLRIYIQVGASDALQRSALETVALLGIPLLGELVWRGLVLDQLTDKLGARRAAPLAALLYAVAAAPTLLTLADPVAGPNPLLVIAAIGCGLVWSYTVSIMGRLPPAIFSHMAFVYFSAVQFRWPGM